MKSSLLFVTAGAILASAGPLQQRDLEIVTVIDVVTQTVTEYTTTYVFATAMETPSVASTPDTEEQQPDGQQGEQQPDGQQQPPPVVKEKPPPVAKQQPQQTDGQQQPQKTDGQQQPQKTDGQQQQTSTPPPQPQEPSGSDKDYIKAILDVHCEVRKMHGVKCLAWNETLAAKSASALKVCGQLVHDSSGQNLIYWPLVGDKMTTIAQGMRERWYDKEVAIYQNRNYYGMKYDQMRAGRGDKDFGADFHDWGHFTQMVWNATTSVGCSSKDCGTHIMTSCNYWVFGNNPGDGNGYKLNVPPPIA